MPRLPERWIPPPKWPFWVYVLIAVLVLVLGFIYLGDPVPSRSR